jgi:hypothetical protein
VDVLLPTSAALRLLRALEAVLAEDWGRMEVRAG